MKICDVSWEDTINNNLRVQRLKEELEVTDAYFEAAKSRYAPNLNLMFSAGSNGIEDTFGEAIEDASNFRNPRYVVGLMFQMPLDMRAERAESLTALRNKTGKELELSQAFGELQADWITSVR